MATSKLVKANEKIAEAVVGAHKGIENCVVGAYKKVESSVVGAYQKVENGFVNRYLTKDGETAEEAKKRLTARDCEKTKSTGGVTAGTCAEIGMDVTRERVEAARKKAGLASDTIKAD